MKQLIMCEGPNELIVITILIEKGYFIYEEDDLLGLVPYFARQIDKSPVVMTELNRYHNNDITILRIGDKQTDELRIPNEYKEKITGGIKYYCTLPEIESLLIISEGLWDEFLKVKSKERAKEFAKKHIKYIQNQN